MAHFLVLHVGGNPNAEEGVSEIVAGNRRQKSPVMDHRRPGLRKEDKLITVPFDRGDKGVLKVPESFLELAHLYVFHAGQVAPQALYHLAFFKIPVVVKLENLRILVRGNLNTVFPDRQIKPRAVDGEFDVFDQRRKAGKFEPLAAYLFFLGEAGLVQAFLESPRFRTALLHLLRLTAAAQGHKTNHKNQRKEKRG